MFRELQDMTTGEWMDLKTSMNKGAFNKIVRMARLGGITIPSGVVPNFNPRIIFETASEVAMYHRVKDIDALEDFNAKVKDWADKVEQELKQSAESSFGHRLSDQLSSEFPRLSESIETNILFDKKYKLETRSVGFKLARHGVYLHQGAGRGYGGLTGSKWTDRYGNIKTTSQDSLGKMGTGARKPVHWFNSVINRNIEELADIAANYSLDVVLNLNRIFLPE